MSAKPENCSTICASTSEGFVQGLVLVSCDASNISGMWKDLSAIFLVTAGANRGAWR